MKGVIMRQGFLQWLPLFPFHPSSSAHWRLREEALPAGSREKTQDPRGSCSESKQTGLCVASDWRLRREARLVVGERGRRYGKSGLCFWP